MARKGKANLTVESGEVDKLEELNARRKKALAEAADLLRQEQDLERARNGDAPEQFAPEEGTPVSEELAAVIEGLDDGGKFWVDRIDERGRAAKVGAYPISDWPDRMDDIAKEAGGGTFRISFRNVKGHPVKQTTQTYDPKFYRKADEPRAQGGNGEIVSLVSSMQSSLTQVMEQSRRDSMDLMKTVLTALGSKPSGPDYKEIALLGELFSRGKTGGDSAEALMKGIELGMSLKEGQEPSSTADRLLETLGPAAAQLLSRIPAPRPATPARPAALPAPLTDAPVIAAPAEPAKPAVSVEEAAKAAVKEHPFYKTYVPKILAAAKAGEDVKEWSETVCDLIPAVYHPKLLDLLQKPDLVEFLGTYEPEARNLAVWITGLRNEINALFPPEEIPGGEGLGGSGSLSMTPAPPGAEAPPAYVEAMTE